MPVVVVPGHSARHSVGEISGSAGHTAAHHGPQVDAQHCNLTPPAGTLAAVIGAGVPCTAHLVTWVAVLPAVDVDTVPAAFVRLLPQVAVCFPLFGGALT